MPSSSSGNTVLERNLIRCFRPVYVHLYVSGAVPYLKTCTIGFANTLHMDSSSLQRVLALTPSMATHSQRLPLCTRLYDAAAACDDLGTLLTERGRVGEGQFWYSRAALLCRDTEEANRRDQMAVEARAREVLTETMREQKRLIETHKELLLIVQVCVKMLPKPHVQPGKRSVESNKLGKRPMRMNRCEKRPMEADECDEVIMSPNKREKKPMQVVKLGERPMEAEEDVSKDQAVKKANIERLEYTFACWRSHLDGRPDGV